MPIIPEVRRQKQGDNFKFKAILVYIESSQPAGVI